MRRALVALVIIPFDGRRCLSGGVFPASAAGAGAGAGATGVAGGAGGEAGEASSGGGGSSLTLSTASVFWRARVLVL